MKNRKKKIQSRCDVLIPDPADPGRISKTVNYVSVSSLRLVHNQLVGDMKVENGNNC